MRAIDLRPEDLKPYIVMWCERYEYQYSLADLDDWSQEIIVFEIEREHRQTEATKVSPYNSTYYGLQAIWRRKTNDCFRRSEVVTISEPSKKRQTYAHDVSLVELEDNHWVANPNDYCEWVKIVYKWIGQFNGMHGSMWRERFELVADSLLFGSTEIESANLVYKHWYPNDKKVCPKKFRRVLSGVKAWKKRLKMYIQEKAEEEQIHPFH